MSYGFAFDRSSVSKYRSAGPLDGVPPLPLIPLPCCRCPYPGVHPSSSQLWSRGPDYRFDAVDSDHCPKELFADDQSRDAGSSLRAFRMRNVLVSSEILGNGFYYRPVQFYLRPSRQVASSL
jgi:hypothetical protein